MGVTVEIDSLVLDGFDPVDTDAFVAAFVAELTLLMSAGIPVSRALVRGAELPSSGSPARLGRALARSVHSGLMRP